MIKKRYEKYRGKRESSKKEELAFTTTKEDHIISDQITNEHNITTAFDKSVKESMSNSKAEFLPKIFLDGQSIRSSKEKELVRDDSGEICEYQDKGNLNKLIGRG